MEKFMVWKGEKPTDFSIDVAKTAEDKVKNCHEARAVFVEFKFI